MINTSLVIVLKILTNIQKEPRICQLLSVHMLRGISSFCSVPTQTISASLLGSCIRFKISYSQWPHKFPHVFFWFPLYASLYLFTGMMFQQVMCLISSCLQQLEAVCHIISMDKTRKLIVTSPNKIPCTNSKLGLEKESSSVPGIRLGIELHMIAELKLGNTRHKGSDRQNQILFI